MNYLEKCIYNLKKYITDQHYRFLINDMVFGHRFLSDEKYIRKMFRAKVGVELNLDKPQSFNEKIQWLKINDRNEHYTHYVDKVAVKQYIADKIGKEYIIPTLGVWHRFDEICFENLPQQFVMKCSHDSAGVVICKDKNSFNYAKARDIITRHLKRNYYLSSREWIYKNVEPRILVEKYLSDSAEDALELQELKDYKFFCFNGKVKCLKIDFDRFKGHHANYYDRKFNLLPFGEAQFPRVPERRFEKPENFDEMINIAERIASGFVFLRVDLYNVCGKIYFGEMTFYPASGFGPFEPKEWDLILGQWLELPAHNC